MRLTVDSAFGVEMWEFFDPSNEKYYYDKSVWFMLGSILVITVSLFVSARRNKTAYWPGIAAFVYWIASICAPVYACTRNVTDQPLFWMYPVFCGLYFAYTFGSVVRNKWKAGSIDIARTELK